MQSSSPLADFMFRIFLPSRAWKTGKDDSRNPSFILDSIALPRPSRTKTSSLLGHQCVCPLFETGQLAEGAGQRDRDLLRY